MNEIKYELRYLSVFYEDVLEKTLYIKNELKNPQAAEQLLDKIERAVLERLPVCECFEQYHSARERKYPYYRIYLNNYVIYYVVNDDNPCNKIMEVRRMLYRKQNRDRIL